MKYKDNSPEPSDMAEGSKVVPGCGDSGEVTPEMIKAGVMALSEYDARLQEPEEAVARVYLAMAKASKNAPVDVH